MSNSDKVRFTRDGDQFHYLWAARRCLRLLSPTSGLVAISVEGPSAKESASGKPLETGEEIIDMAEYFGSEDIQKATRVRYIQLKHSTQNPTLPWPPSGLENTLSGFSNRYKELLTVFDKEALKGRFEFVFVTNRPINFDFIEAIEDAAAKASNRHPQNLEKLQKFTSLNGDQLSVFCQLLWLKGGHENYWFQRGALAQETKAYLPGNDVDAPVQLKELVTRKALSESKENPSITKTDVLRALGTTEDRIFPAPSFLETAEKSIPRVQESNLVARIVSASTPVIVHAPAGVGKSILSQRIKLHLPKGSIAVVYDCFGNGEWRRPGHPRHRHKDALVQIANELARHGLCDPLIPSASADNTDYLRAFAHRVMQGSTLIKARDPNALLCIIIDAADNAAMAAKELEANVHLPMIFLKKFSPMDFDWLCFAERRGSTFLSHPQLSCHSNWNHSPEMKRPHFSDKHTLMLPRMMLMSFIG